MPPDVVPLDLQSLDIHEVTLPDEQDMLVRLNNYDHSNYAVKHLHPLIAFYLAGEPMHPVGVLNALVLAATVFGERVNDDLARRTVLESTPAYLNLMFDDEHVRHQMQCLWLWFKPHLKGQ